MPSFKDALLQGDIDECDRLLVSFHYHRRPETNHVKACCTAQLAVALYRICGILGYFYPKTCQSRYLSVCIHAFTLLPF